MSSLWLTVVIAASIWMLLGVLALVVKYRTRGGRGDVPGSGTAVIGVRDVPAWFFIPILVLYLAVLVAGAGLVGVSLLLCALLLVGWILQRGVCLRGMGEECMRCGFERPPDRHEASEVCPECANRWWIKPHPQAALKPFSTDRAGVRPLGWTEGLRRVRILCATVALLALLYAGFIGWLHLGNLEAHLPTGVLIGMMDDTDVNATNDLLEEVFGRQGLTQKQADRAMDILMDRVESGENPLRFMPDEFENALMSGVFSDAALNRFYVDALRWGLDAEPQDDGTLRLLVRFEGRARGIWAAPDVVPCRVRVNDDAWMPLSGTQSQPQMIATTFVDRAMVEEDGTGVFDETDDRYSHIDPTGLAPISIVGLGPGEHTVTVLLYETVYDFRSRGGFHSFLDPTGRPIPHPREVWGEEVELTATFTIPEGQP